MPSASEFKALLEQARDRLQDIKSILDTKLDELRTRLDTLHTDVQQVNTSVHQVNGTLVNGFGQLITQAAYTNQALHHNAQQNDTMICILEHISKNTCLLLNEAHVQTGLQTTIRNSTSLLADLYAATHAEAALTRQREEALRKQIEECCPPEVPPPPCDYAPCPAPKPLGEPPKVDPRQRRG